MEHLEFAYRVAGHYAARTPIPRDDLQQEAAIGLLKAARRYDPGHGSPRPGHFRAYARFGKREWPRLGRHQHATQSPRGIKPGWQ